LTLLGEPRRRRGGQHAVARPGRCWLVELVEVFAHRVVAGEDGGVRVGGDAIDNRVGYITIPIGYPGRLRQTGAPTDSVVDGISYCVYDGRSGSAGSDAVRYRVDDGSG
jgi:hypothetical protein